MQGLTGAHQQLKVSADKLNISKKALEEVQKAPEGACRGGPPTVGACSRCSCCARPLHRLGGTGCASGAGLAPGPALPRSALAQELACSCR